MNVDIKAHGSFPSACSQMKGSTHSCFSMYHVLKHSGCGDQL